MKTRTGYKRRELREEELVDLGDEVKLVHATAKAILVDLDGEEHWIPKSLLREGSTVQDVAVGAVGQLVLPEWFAKKERIL